MEKGWLLLICGQSRLVKIKALLNGKEDSGLLQIDAKISRHAMQPSTHHMLLITTNISTLLPETTSFQIFTRPVLTELFSALAESLKEAVSQIRFHFARSHF